MPHVLLEPLVEGVASTECKQDLKKSTVPTNREHHIPGHRSHRSREFLNPAHDSTLRRSSPDIALINLVATVCGGGVLSLPYSFRRAGILVTLALLIISAIMTNFSLYILCACARRTGGRSYGDVARAAFGPLAEILTTATLFVLLVGILVAYMVLLKGIWTPMILSLAVSLNIIKGFDEEHFDEQSNALLLVLLFCLFPLLLKRDLYALRYTCYVGFCSLVVLTVGVATRAYQRNVVVQPAKKVLWWTSDVKDVIFVFPIVMMSFLCCFNVLGVHGSLIEPTRKRLRLVLDGSIGICLILFSIVGICGYLDTYDDTKDNVFLDYPISISTPIILLGRIGYAFTILFGIPLVLLPCRESCLSIPVQIIAWRYEVKQRQLFASLAANSNLVNGVNAGREMPPSGSQGNKPVYGSTDYGTSTSSTIENGDSDGSVADETFWEYLVHVSSTAALLVLAYVAAATVPGVAIVLSICGSSMAMLISFIIPAACYIKIRWHKPMNPRSIGAWILLVCSSVAAIVCTTHTLSEIFVA
jgi:amino acid permease